MVSIFSYIHTILTFHMMIFVGKKNKNWAAGNRSHCSMLECFYFNHLFSAPESFHVALLSQSDLCIASQLSEWDTPCGETRWETIAEISESEKQFHMACSKRQQKEKSSMDRFMFALPTGRLWQLLKAEMWSATNVMRKSTEQLQANILTEIQTEGTTENKHLRSVHQKEADTAQVYNVKMFY